MVESQHLFYLGNAEIGSDVNIGAGSAINRNAPAGELTVARSRQGVVQGWKRPTRKS